MGKQIKSLPTSEVFWPTLGLGMSALVGDRDAYLQVFWAPKVIPGSLKILSHGSLELQVKKPAGQQVSMGIPVSKHYCHIS